MADETLDQAADTSDEEQSPQVTDTEVTNTEAARKPPRVGAAIPDSVVFVQPPPVS